MILLWLKRNQSLTAAILCLRDNNIVNDQAVLQYLRQERNNRAHGTMPTLAERKVLMNSIQFTAGMYIDYCKLFDEMTVSLL